MIEVLFLSLLVSSLGFEAVLISSWIYSEQKTLKQQIEEETLTPYESANAKASKPLQPNSHSEHQKQLDDPALSESEYKIVRANRDLFRNPAIFHKLCEEEAEVGWIMLEKLDDRRVRFKRPANLRDHEYDQSSDELPRFDPYRTHYGSSLDFTSWLAAIAFLTAIVLPAYLGYALVSATLNNLPNSLPRIPLLNPPPEVTPEVEQEEPLPEEIPEQLETEPQGI
ncbi:hypothetical protein [Lyngbya sp. PCC 8106]|uniref:hypothetical protein n=1 Tax=Lyngbya sp. (strain PCC 8106) TaxID=313612 RepID=UPI0000EAA8D0|nr:hypothetical protein [Lyngbya sp. PCC 8106]EAW37434.1 hypothetical protein L8106_00365 [Lyngbya sp. PCC 8106]